MRYVVQSGAKIYGEFESYDEAIVLWRKAYKKDRAVVIRDLHQVKWILLFLLIQAVNIPLMVLGWAICLWPHLAHALWLWWNDDDPPWNKSWWAAYVWLAWRNPVSNIRKVPGVSAAGRPLWYWSNQRWYFKAGWESSGGYYPVLSAGTGRGY